MTTATYYGRPVLKPPTWKWEIPAYLFSGGLAGASATLAAAARAAGNRELARRALGVAAAGAAVSPPLLIADLGRPSRFLNMWRVAKPSSPMSVGSWLLTAFAPAVLGAAATERLGVLPRVGRVLEAAAGALGPAMATYTAVLVADTAIPAWHEAGRELPFVFAGGAAASAGAAAAALTPVASAGPARRLAVLGAVGSVAAAGVMERRLGEVAVHHRGPVATAARALLLGGAAALAGPGRHHRAVAAGAGAMVVAGAALERVAVFEAGRRSAADPTRTVRARPGPAPGRPAC